MSIQQPSMPNPPSQKDKWQSPGWYNALSLTERAALCKANLCQPSTQASSRHERATNRLNEWKAQRPFEQGTLFADRLDQDSLDEAEFLGLLEQSASDLQDVYLRTSSAPAWLATLQEAFGGIDQSGDEDGSFFNDISLAPYLQPLLPLLKHDLRQLNAGFQALHPQDTMPLLNRNTL